MSTARQRSKREEVFPNLLTQAYLELPFLVAMCSLERRYEGALALLEKHRSRLTFPADHFLWHAAYALILDARGNRTNSASHAEQALEAAKLRDSEFRYHRDLGLVSNRHKKLIDRLIALGAA